MHTSSSAKRTCSDSRSASEYTATVSMPSSWHARMMRRAISPRLAIRTFWNKDLSPSSKRARLPPGARRAGVGSTGLPSRPGAPPIFAYAGSTRKSTCPYSTGWAFSTRISTMVPSTSLSSSFMSFIASMMQRVSPLETRVPFST